MQDAGLNLRDNMGSTHVTDFRSFGLIKVTHLEKFFP